MPLAHRGYSGPMPPLDGTARGGDIGRSCRETDRIEALRALYIDIEAESSHAEFELGARLRPSSRATVCLVVLVVHVAALL